jgi:hypothetical protein
MAGAEEVRHVSIDIRTAAAAPAGAAAAAEHSSARFVPVTGHGHRRSLSPIELPPAAVFGGRRFEERTGFPQIVGGHGGMPLHAAAKGHPPGLGVLDDF